MVKISYDDFRTGLTYSDVYQMLWSPSEWRYKRRRTVLGFWHQLKQQLYARMCDDVETAT